MQGVNLKDNDYVDHLFVASTHSYMLFFTSKGLVYRLKVYEIPEASRHARGTYIGNLLHLEKGEEVAAVIASKDFPEDEFLIFGTEQGMVKKTAMSAYDRTRRDGLIAINLKDGDRLIAVKRVAKGDMVIMASSAGKVVKWDESEARAMGRGTTGVRGVTLPFGAKALGLEVCNMAYDPELFVITEKGYGKRTDVSEYPTHHRGGQGVFTINMTDKKGQLVDVKVVRPEEEMMIMSEEGVVVRTSVKGISKQGRATQGVHVMKVAENDRITAVAISRTKAKKVGKASEVETEEDIDTEE